MTHEVRYSREAHAAHYVWSNDGHDLEKWTVCASVQVRDVTRLGIPADAKYHSGYMDADRRQWWTYVRIAPLTPKPGCAQCAAREKEAAHD